jgi:hypothetical protein
MALESIPKAGNEVWVISVRNGAARAFKRKILPKVGFMALRCYNMVVSTTIFTLGIEGMGPLTGEGSGLLNQFAQGLRPGLT